MQGQLLFEVGQGGQCFLVEFINVQIFLSRVIRGLLSQAPTLILSSTPSLKVCKERDNDPLYYLAKVKAYTIFGT